jgi:HEAT repeat protein
MRAPILACILATFAATGCAAATQREAPSVAALLRELDAELPDRRLEAARALARKGPEVVPALVHALSHKSWRVRRSAADALAGLRAEAKPAVGALVKALSDDEPWVRAGAAAALGRIGPDAKEAAAALADAAGDRDLWVRKCALEALARGRGADDDAVLLRAAVAAMAFPDTGWAAKRFALAILRRHGKQHTAAVPALLATLEQGPEGMWDGTLGVVELLTGMGAGAKALPVLTKRLDAPNRTVRRRAIESLGIVGKAAAPAAPALRAIADKDGDKRTREAAAEALRRIEGIKKP